MKFKLKTNFYLKDFPNETFKSDGKILFCTSCEKAVLINHRFSVIQSTSTSKYQKNRDRNNKFQQNFLNSEPSLRLFIICIVEKSGDKLAKT